MTIKRIRKINAAVKEIKAADPGSAVTYHAIRRAILDGKIPAGKSGGDYTVDLDVILDYFAGGGEA